MTRQVVYLAVAECMDGTKRNFVCTDAGVTEDSRTLDEMAEAAYQKGFDGIFTNNWCSSIPGWIVERIQRQVFNVVSTTGAQLNRNTFVSIERRLIKYAD